MTTPATVPGAKKKKVHRILMFTDFVAVAIETEGGIDDPIPSGCHGDGG